MTFLFSWPGTTADVACQACGPVNVLMLVVNAFATWDRTGSSSKPHPLFDSPPRDHGIFCCVSSAHVRHFLRVFPHNIRKNVFYEHHYGRKKPLFCRGEERHELWGFLLEKAYAKAHGCYENLMHGDTREALRDLTGGVSEKLQWQLGGRPGAAGASAATPGQAAPEQQQEIPRPRVAGWGILAGTTPPLGWVFENIRDRLSDGQVLGCRSVSAFCSCERVVFMPPPPN